MLDDAVHVNMRSIVILDRPITFDQSPAILVVYVLPIPYGRFLEMTSGFVENIRTPYAVFFFFFVFSRFFRCYSPFIILWCYCKSRRNQIGYTAHVCARKNGCGLLVLFELKRLCRWTKRLIDNEYLVDEFIFTSETMTDYWWIYFGQQSRTGTTFHFFLV